MAMKVSPAHEDYLECIYRLEEARDQVRVKDLAEALSIKAPSVTEALTALKEKGLVVQEPYQGVSLSPAGREMARRVFGRHCVLRRFFEEVLGIGHVRAEEEACAMEHGMGTETAERMRRFLQWIDEQRAADPTFLKRF